MLPHHSTFASICPHAFKFPSVDVGCSHHALWCVIKIAQSQHGLTSSLSVSCLGCWLSLLSLLGPLWVCGCCTKVKSQTSRQPVIACGSSGMEITGAWEDVFWKIWKEGNSRLLGESPLRDTLFGLGDYPKTGLLNFMYRGQKRFLFLILHCFASQLRDMSRSYML